MPTRIFTRAQLEALGIPNKWTASEGQAAERLYEELLSTRRWVSVHRLVFRAPDDGRAYAITYERGLTEEQEDPDPFDSDDKMAATAVEQQQATVTRWVAISEERS